MNTRLATTLVIGTLIAPTAGYAADTMSKDKPSVTEKIKENVGDAVITTRIKTEFAKDKDVSALNIKIDTDDKGVVTLSGNAKSKAEADKAVKIAGDTKGVTAIKNNIMISDTGAKKSMTESVKENVGDAVITTRIKAQFAKDKQVSALNIKVDTDDKGVVTLSGNAKSKAEADKAVAIAKKTKGVTAVKNEIKLATATSSGDSMAKTGSADKQRSDQPIDDTVITTRVKARMATDKLVSATNISVKTVNGVVELSGTAKSKAEADQAVAIARGVDHVKSVKNEIKVLAM